MLRYWQTSARQVREVRQKINDVTVAEVREKGEKFHNTKLPERMYPKFARLDKMQTAASLRHPQMRHLKKAKDETPRNSVETLDSHQLDRPEIKDIRYVKNRVPLWRVEQTINAANNRAAFQQNKLDETTYADADEYRFKEFDYMPSESMIGRDHNLGFEPYEFQWPEETESYFKGKNYTSSQTSGETGSYR